MHIMTKESVVSWYISTSGFTNARIKTARCSVQTHENSISRRNIAWFISLHAEDDGSHNVKSHDVERREGVWYFLQLMSTQETEFPCDSTQSSNGAEQKISF